MAGKVQPTALQPQVAAAQQLAARALGYLVRANIQLRVAEQRAAVVQLAVVNRQLSRLGGALAGEIGAGQGGAIGHPRAAVGGVCRIQDQVGGLQPAGAGELRRAERQARAGEESAVVTRLRGGGHARLAAALDQAVVKQRGRGQRQRIAADDFAPAVVGQRPAEGQRRAVIALQTSVVGERPGGDAERAPLHFAVAGDGGRRDVQRPAGQQGAARLLADRAGLAEGQAIHAADGAAVAERAARQRQVFRRPLALVRQRRGLQRRRTQRGDPAACGSGERIGQRHLQRTGALHRAAVGERPGVKQDVLRLPAAGVGHRAGRNRQSTLGEKLTACAIDQLLLRRGHRHARHQPLLPLNGQALQTGQGALVVNAVLMQREGIPLHGAAVFKRAAAERHIALAEELPAVIQRLCGDIRPALAHQRAG